MILLDTNVLIYAAGGAHPLREPSRRVLAAAREGTVHGATTTPVLLELLHTWSRRRLRAEATQLVRSYRDVLTLVSEPAASTLERAAVLFAEHGRLQAADAHLVATALEVDADLIVTADRGFDGIPGVVRRAPDDPALAAYLGAG